MYIYRKGIYHTHTEFIHMYIYRIQQYEYVDTYDSEFIRVSMWI